MAMYSLRTHKERLAIETLIHLYTPTKQLQFSYLRHNVAPYMVMIMTLISHHISQTEEDSHYYLKKGQRLSDSEILRISLKIVNFQIMLRISEFEFLREPPTIVANFLEWFGRIIFLLTGYISLGDRKGSSSC